MIYIVLYIIFQAGCVSKFKLDVKNIVGTVAKDAENKGHFEDAAMLYDLADVGILKSNPILISHSVLFLQKYKFALVYKILILNIFDIFLFNRTTKRCWRS